jgi:hypothetical protein
MNRLVAAAGLFLAVAAASAQSPTPSTNASRILGGKFEAASQEQAQQGSLLVGFEIGLGKFVDREVLRSLRPIYRSAQGEETKGKQYGTPEGTVFVAKAKAGYAVSGVKLRTGLLLEGISVTFMKTDGTTLDRNETYETVWIGNQTGGRTSTQSGNGIPVVGFAARVSADGKQCSSIGLILKYPRPEDGSPRLTRLNRDDFKKIKTGMNEDQVISIMGPPDATGQRSGKVLNWTEVQSNPNGTYTVRALVTLRGGKVMGSDWQQFYSPKR